MDEVNELKGPWVLEDLYLIGDSIEDLLQFFPLYDNYYLLGFVTAGSITIRMDGHERVYTKNSFGSFTPKCFIELVAISPDFKVMGFTFQKDLMLEIQESAFYLNSFRVLQYRGITKLDLSPAQAKQMENMFLDFERRVNKLTGSYYKGRCRALTVTFLYELEYLLHEELALENNNHLSEDERLCYDFEIHLYRDFKKHRKVAYYASLSGLPPAKFSQVVREILGRTTKEVIDDVVLSQSKSWLKTGYYNVSEISQMLNYANVEEFSRFFKLKMGLTPSQFVKSEKEKNFITI